MQPMQLPAPRTTRIYSVHVKASATIIGNKMAAEPGVRGIGSLQKRISCRSSSWLASCDHHARASIRARLTGRWSMDASNSRCSAHCRPMRACALGIDSLITWSLDRVYPKGKYRRAFQHSQIPKGFAYKYAPCASSSLRQEQLASQHNHK
jgi:hypothetical protein